MKQGRFSKGCVLVLLLSALVVSPLLNAQSHWLAELYSAAAGEEETVPPKCGLPVLANALVAQPKVTAAILDRYRSARQQKTMDSMVSPSGHFLIFYETSGVDAIPTYDRNQDGFPDYLDFVAISLDRAWEVEIDSLGFAPPPDANGQPREVYEVFCRRLSRGFYGSTLWFSNQDIPSLPGLNFVSELEINTDFSFVNYPAANNDPIVRDSLAIAVTAAHEFNHAIQLGYRLWSENDNFLTDISDLRYIESSATYMEEVVADQVNDYYQYLPSFYRNTERNLGDSDVLYGDVILHIMLGELYGKNITRRVWEEIRQRPALPALEEVLQRQGSDLTSELRRLATWMFFSGPNALPGLFFKEAVEYPAPNLTETEFLSLNRNERQLAFSGQLPPLAFKLFKIPVATLAEEVSISLAPQQFGDTWQGVELRFEEPYGQPLLSGIFSAVPFSPPQGDLFVGAISGSRNSQTGAGLVNYELYLRNAGSGVSDEIAAYPNVVKPGQEASQITFINLPDEAVVEIFSSNGLRLASVRPGSNRLVAVWDLRTFQGETVSSGVYIYRVVSPESSVSGKILIIR